MPQAPTPKSSTRNTKLRKKSEFIAREKGVPFKAHEDTPSLRYPNQATFPPLKYLAGLAKSIKKAGGRFYAETTVEHVEEDENGVEVTAGRHTVRARHAMADAEKTTKK
jgi:hypothetical protein